MINDDNYQLDIEPKKKNAMLLFGRFRLSFAELVVSFNYIRVYMIEVKSFNLITRI